MNDMFNFKIKSAKFMRNERPYEPRKLLDFGPGKKIFNP